MTIIEIPEDKREEVLTILLDNGSFSSLDKNTFAIEENAEETIKKLKDKGIKIKIVEQ